MTIKPVLVPDHNAADLRDLMNRFSTAAQSATPAAQANRIRQQLTESAEPGVAEARPDVMRHRGDKTVKIVKRAGKPIGEIGTDAEASPGNGQYYVKLYDGSYDAVGYDTAEEALAELKAAIKQGVAEGGRLDMSSPEEKAARKAYIKAHGHPPPLTPDSVVAKYNPENDKKVRDYYLRRKGIPQDKLDKMKEDGVAEGEKPEYQKLLKQIKQNAKNDPNRIPRGYELTDHGMLVKKHKTEKSNDGVGGLGEGMVEGTFQDDGKMDWNAWKQKAKKHGAVKFTDTDNKTIAYDKDGKVVSSITWSQKKSGMAEATGDTSFDSMMGNIVKGARYKGAAADQRADAAYSGMMNNITKNAADVAKPSADSKFEQVYSAVERILLSNNVHWDIDDDISDALKKLKIKASDALMQKLERELINRVSDALQYYDDGDLAESGVAEGSENNPVVNAITRRIMMQRSDLLSKYGPEKVGQAVDEVADFVGNVEEIGSSDVSGWVRHVEQMLGNMEQDVAEEAAAPTFKPGDRVMYAGKFATVVAQDGDAYGIRVDAQPGTMKVLASQIKKPSYDESVAESIDPIEQLRADIRRFAL
jgi:hypothetical protein